MQFKLSRRRAQWAPLAADQLEYWCPNKKMWERENCGCLPEIDCSVITAVVDRAEGLQVAIESLNQQGRDLRIEHVVVDGSATKSHQDLISSSTAFHTVYAWKLDRSLYDAFNLGWRLSRGQYIAYLNSDDWYEPHFLTRGLAALKLSGCDWVFGDVTFHDPTGSSFEIVGQPNYFMNTWTNFSKFHHTTVIAKRDVFDSIGDFPERVEVAIGPIRRVYWLPYCADYAWFAAAQQAGFWGMWTPAIMGHMSTGGASASDPMGTEKVYLEACAVSMALFPEARRFAPTVWLLRYLHTKLRARGGVASLAVAAGYRVLKLPYSKVLSRQGSAQ